MPPRGACSPGMRRTWTRGWSPWAARPRGAAAQFAGGSLTTALTRGAHCRVVLLRRDEPARELTDEGLGELAAAGA